MHHTAHPESYSGVVRHPRTISACIISQQCAACITISRHNAPSASSCPIPHNFAPTHTISHHSARRSGHHITVYHSIQNHFAQPSTDSAQSCAIPRHHATFRAFNVILYESAPHSAIQQSNTIKHKCAHISARFRTFQNLLTTFSTTARLSAHCRISERYRTPFGIICSTEQHNCPQYCLHLSWRTFLMTDLCHGGPFS